MFSKVRKTGERNPGSFDNPTITQNTMKGKNAVKRKTPVIPMTGAAPTGEKAPQPTIPQDVQDYLDGVKDEDLRGQLTQHALVVDALKKQLDGTQRYAEALKKQREEFERAYHDILSNQRVFIATSALQGLIANTNDVDTLHQKVQTSLKYADLMMSELFPPAPVEA